MQEMINSGMGNGQGNQGMGMGIKRTGLVVRDVKETIEYEQQIELKRKLENGEQDLTDKESILSGLEGYIQSLLTSAQNQKISNGIKDVLDRCLRMKKGQYGDEVAKAINSTGMSSVFMPLTSQKITTAAAWISDIVQPDNDFVWKIEPTPIPEIDNEAMIEAVKSETMKYFEKRMQEQAEAGLPPPDPMEAFKYSAEMYDQLEAMEVKEARISCDRMTRVIKDQFIEGGFGEALSDFIVDLCTYPCAILKAPVIRKEMMITGFTPAEPNGGGREAIIESRIMPTYERVSPFDFFPGANTSSPNRGYIFQRSRMYRNEIQKLKGLPNYSSAKIDEALNLYGAGGLRSLEIQDYPRESMEGKQPVMSASNGDATIDVWEFWGSAPGNLLKQFGVKDIDENEEYEVMAVQIGGIVIKCVLNSDPLGRRPYFVTSWEKDSETIWGSGLPQKMEAIQGICNSCIRALDNNLSISSGPQILVNTAMLPAGEDIQRMYPFKVWQYVDKGGNAGKPFDFFQPNSNSTDLLGIYGNLKTEADDVTSIPRYAQGVAEGAMRGAAGTARGLSMLMSAASKNIKYVINNIDKDIVKPILMRMYEWNMMYNDKEAIKMGDVKVRPSGAIGVMIAEQVQAERQQFLNLASSNEAIQQMIGRQGFAKLLRAIVKDLDFPDNMIIPSENEIEEQGKIAEQEQKNAMQQQEQMMQMQAMGQGGGNVPEANVQPGTPGYVPPNEQQEQQQMQAGAVGNQAPIE